MSALVRFNMEMAKETENLNLDVETLQRGVSTVLEGETAAAYYVVEEANQVVGSLMLTVGNSL
eukprot:scaffold221245_cov24-Tisochrysis_lutea.AAC.1